jgi:hypothetical protein
MRHSIELQALRAELVAIGSLLEEAKASGDITGEIQFSQRRCEIEEAIGSIKLEERDRASVALYFDGKPVFGTRGIETEFAGKSLEGFQDIVTKHYASKERGQLGERGTVPLKDSATLLVTGITRGSFGFVLEEVSDQADLFESSLKHAVAEVVEVIGHSASGSDEIFEDAVVDLDNRILSALQAFFTVLDTNEATLRIAEDNKAIFLDSNDIRRARQRTEATQIDESQSVFRGRLTGFLPERRRFEMALVAEGKEFSIHGSSTKEAALQFSSLVGEPRPVIGEEFSVEMLAKTIRPRNRVPKTAYQMLRFID